jgi:hypothetical protein
MNLILCKFKATRQSVWPHFFSLPRRDGRFPAPGYSLFDYLTDLGGDDDPLNCNIYST